MLVAGTSCCSFCSLWELHVGCATLHYTWCRARHCLEVVNTGMRCILYALMNEYICNAGLAASVGLAETVYGVSANVILDSACRAITSWDIITSCIKSWVFGTIIAVVSITVHAYIDLLVNAQTHC